MLLFDTEQEARAKFDSITGGYDNLELGYTGEYGDETEWIDNKFSDRFASCLSDGEPSSQEPSSQGTEE